MTVNRPVLIRELLRDMLRVEDLALRQLGERFESSLGATLAELDVLSELNRAPDRRLTMGEISRRLTISTTSVTRVVDGLEDAGLAARQLSRDDRRVVHATITPAGAKLLQRARPIAGPILEECFGRHFSTDDLLGMRATLRRVLDEVDEPPSERIGGSSARDDSEPAKGPP